MKKRSVMAAIVVIVAWALPTVVFAQSAADLVQEIMKGELRDTRKISDRYFEIYPDRKKEIKGK